MRLFKKCRPWIEKVSMYMFAYVPFVVCLDENFIKMPLLICNKVNTTTCLLASLKNMLDVLWAGFP